MVRGSIMRFASAGLVTGALLGACASPAPVAGPSAPPSPSTGPTAAVSSSAAAAPTRTPVAASPKSSQPARGGTGATALTGTVVSVAVEGGCLGLKADGTDGFKTYELIGGDRTVLRPGTRVRVTGRVRTDLATTCQIGTPFEVASAERM